MKIIVEFQGDNLTIEKVNGKLLAIYDKEIVFSAYTWDSMMQNIIGHIEQIERNKNNV